MWLYPWAMSPIAVSLFVAFVFVLGVMLERQRLRRVVARELLTVARDEEAGARLSRTSMPAHLHASRCLRDFATRVRSNGLPYA